MARRKFKNNKSGGAVSRNKKKGSPRRHAGQRHKMDDRGAKALRGLEDTLIGYLYKADEAVGVSEIMAALSVVHRDEHKIHTLLQDLCEKKILSCKSKKHYAISKAAVLLEGSLVVNPRGFGFVTVENPPPGLKIDKDVFVPANALGSAAHGDRVLLKITGQEERRFEGRIVTVLARGVTRLVGIYTAGRLTGLVVPEDDRFPFSVVVAREFSRAAKSGQAVVVDITDHQPGQRNPEGRIVEVLGNPEDIQVQTEITIHNYDLPHQFSVEAMQEAENLSDATELSAGRVDLRDIVHVTIDGEDARDFDDAVAIEKKGPGYRLYVSIADVSHYVRPGTMLDKEAYARGTSVYFPTRVVPMLPERLSNNLCSLMPEQDRYAFTAILDIDDSGRLRTKKFTRSLIKSRYRLTYLKVKNMLVDQDLELCRQYAEIQQPLKWMANLAAILEKKRMKRGSIGFEMPEALIELGDDGAIINIGRRERNMAHKLIEEFMLAANEAVATTFTEKGVPAIYRVHEEPEPERIEEFSDFAATMGLRLPKGQGTPQWFGSVLKMVAGRPQEYIVNNLLLRSMKQARYAAENIGHFGLAAANYTHFTSPIRRYPDLIVHRTLMAMLHKETGKAAKAIEAGSLGEAGDFLSKRERVAVDAEREMVDRLKVRFMAGQVGEIFKGVVSGVSSFGMFVELLDNFVSGAVPVTELLDDYYELDDKNHRLIGRGSNKIYQLGDLLRVRVASVDIRRRRVNFAVVEG